jgi:hypothetical protein
MMMMPTMMMMILFFGTVCWRFLFFCAFCFLLLVSGFWFLVSDFLFLGPVRVYDFFTTTMTIPRISFSITRRRYTLLFAASAESGWNPGIGGFLMLGFLYSVCVFDFFLAFLRLV